MVITQQAPQAIMMVKPHQFAFNPQTALSNEFQNEVTFTNINERVQAEFDAFAKCLSDHSVEVYTFDDDPAFFTPDSIFPNNWISVQPDGKMILYPMEAENRRLERNPAIIEKLQEKFAIQEVIDLSGFEKENKFLEGTGSIIFDYPHQLMYACLSSRTDQSLVELLAKKLKMQAITFSSFSPKQQLVYHTNVILSVGTSFAICCMDSISDEKEKEKLLQTFRKTNKELIEISWEQTLAFAGNLLEIENSNGEKLIILSQTAFEKLTANQLKKLSEHGKLVPIKIPTIESIGGGSVRCMMAGIHATKN